MPAEDQHQLAIATLSPYSEENGQTPAIFNLQYGIEIMQDPAEKKHAVFIMNYK